MKEYISKDRAKQFVCGHCNEVCSEKPCESSDCDWMAFIDKEPAADVVEVRHGRWEAWMPDKNGETREFICTGCRFMVEMSWKQKECDYEWCPYCGCKMDKEAADGKKQPEEAPGE